MFFLPVAEVIQRQIIFKTYKTTNWTKFHDLF